MSLDRTLGSAACLFFASAIASAQVAGQPESSASNESNPMNPSTGVGLQAATSSSRPSFELGSASTSQNPEGVATPSVQTAAANSHAGVYKDARGVRHDPKGKKGISPFWDAIRRGDEAAMAGDFIKAEASYNAAAEIAPRHPIAPLRLGQVLIRAGKLTQAETAYQQALELTEKDVTLHAAALFVLADLKERQGRRDEAILAWKAYAEYLRKEPSARGYLETPTEREQRISRYKEVAADSKNVRERIELRVKEVDAANQRKAAQNPNANR